MPKAKRPHPRAIVDDIPTPPEPYIAFHDDEPEPERTPETRSSRRRTQNAVPRRSPTHESSPEALLEGQITSEEPSPRPQYADLLAPPVKTKPVNISVGCDSTRLIEQFTPPSEYGIAPDTYDGSPQADSLAVSSKQNTPPQPLPVTLQPAFSKTSFLQQRQPVAQAQTRHARPPSFVGNIPPLPTYLPSPSTYGSPPPVLPTQLHFHGIADFDSGMTSKGRLIFAEKPCFTKFAKLPQSAIGRHGIVSGYERMVEIKVYDGIVIQELGILSNLPGTVIDAEILSWTDGVDPLAAVRPLIALTLFHVEQLPDGSPCRSSSVQVYSLSTQQHICELLRTPVRPAHTLLPNLLHVRPDSSDLLRLKASGNVLAVSSGVSGEVFVFTVTIVGEHGVFDCIGKFWTTIQPRPVPKNISHSQTPINNPVPAPVMGEENVPVMTVSGRWLAVCAPPSASSQSINAALGETVRVTKHAGLDLISPASRPAPSCIVESPDVDTMMSKIARSAAQGVMKGGHWIASTGVQAWNSYWRKDDGSSEILSSTQNISRPSTNVQDLFPPTHAEVSGNSKDPMVVAIYDLKALQKAKKHTATPTAVFEPPKGCSFLSFAPHGLQLLTASRKGDYHYVWDLFECKYVRQASAHVEDGSRPMTKVRQVARYERLSGSVIMDVVWDVVVPTRFALLTRNKTVHLYDLPASASRWPPPRTAQSRAVSAPSIGDLSLHRDPPRSGGFLASVTTFASNTQSSLASLRTRAPSVSGGISGIGAAGFGLAAATGARGARAVGSGISKSLSAASGAVVTARHSGETRMPLKNVKPAVAGRLVWTSRSEGLGICLLEDSALRFYRVRKGKDGNAADRPDVTVFEARNPIIVKFSPNALAAPQIHETAEPQGEWHVPEIKTPVTDASHPLSHAEIETNLPYMPFHSDHRVTLFTFTRTPPLGKKHKCKPSNDVWVFGDPIATTKLDLGHHAQVDDNDEDGSVIIRDTNMSATITGNEDYIVSTARRKRFRRRAGIHEGEPGEEGFFEDDCHVLEFATDRV